MCQIIIYSKGQGDNKNKTDEITIVRLTCINNLNIYGVLKNKLKGKGELS